MPNIASLPSDGPRHFNDYLTPMTPQIVSAESPEILTIVSPLVSTNTITTMMESIKRSGNIDLAMHLLRITLRETAHARQVWLAKLENGMARQDVLDAAFTVEPAEGSDPVQAIQATAEVQAIPEVIQATPEIPSTSEIASIELPQRRLLVSAQWFEAVHLLARSGSDTIWAAAETRRLMDAELQSLAEEHLLLSGISIEDPLDDVSPSAPIYAIQTVGGLNTRAFDPLRHLRHLRKTFNELSKLSTMSIQQQERRRIATKAKNARRWERQVEALKIEQEKAEAKQALRRRRDEIQEAPLALA